MASDKNRFLVSAAFAEPKDKTAQNGDFSYHGYVFQDVPMTLRDAVRELRRCTELSRHPINAQDSMATWAETEWEMDYRSGVHRSESVHVKSIDGSDLSGQNMVRLYRLAGLC